MAYVELSQRWAFRVSTIEYRIISTQDADRYRFDIMRRTINIPPHARDENDRSMYSRHKITRSSEERPLHVKQEVSESPNSINDTQKHLLFVKVRETQRSILR